MLVTEQESRSTSTQLVDLFSLIEEKKELINLTYYVSLKFYKIKIRRVE